MAELNAAEGVCYFIDLMTHTRTGDKYVVLRRMGIGGSQEHPDFVITQAAGPLRLKEEHAVRLNPLAWDDDRTIPLSLFNETLHEYAFETISLRHA